MIGNKYIDPHGSEWTYNGFGLTDGIRFIPINRALSHEEAELLFIGYKAGHNEGVKIGRSILQNEFRNLMDCQPR